MTPIHAAIEIAFGVVGVLALAILAGSVGTNLPRFAAALRG